VLTEAFNVNLEELVTKDYLSARFAEERAYIDKRFAEVDGNFKALYWIQAIIVAATVTPWLERLLSLS